MDRLAWTAGNLVVLRVVISAANITLFCISITQLAFIPKKSWSDTLSELSLFLRPMYVVIYDIDMNINKKAHTHTYIYVYQYPQSTTSNQLTIWIEACVRALDLVPALNSCLRPCRHLASRELLGSAGEWLGHRNLETGENGDLRWFKHI